MERLLKKFRFLKSRNRGEGKMRRKTVLLVATVVVLLVGSLAGALLNGFVLGEPDGPASVPPLINYQGVLVDPATGNPVADGEYEFVFSIYDTDSVGSPLWQETQPVTVQNGLFNVLLGSYTALNASLFDGSLRYLGIKVGEDEEMI